MILWAYPREFTDAGVGGPGERVTATVSPPSAARPHLLLLTQGYAILDDPTMPIVGAGETANDTYVEQLVASAKAAVDTVVAMGVADPDRIGVGGHSYGAFMTANLLAHCDLFRAGIASSGAYNRTLTPFGFQSETRTFWEVPDLYAKMSPFWHAPKVNEPILLIHGAADNNSGTFPIQSERFYVALKGHGATVRYVVLPHESHGYAARESVLHTVAEMLNWMDTYVKNAKPREAKAATSSTAVAPRAGRDQDSTRRVTCVRPCGCQSCPMVHVSRMERRARCRPFRRRLAQRLHSRHPASARERGWRRRRPDGQPPRPRGNAAGRDDAATASVAATAGRSAC